MELDCRLLQVVSFVLKLLQINSLSVYFYSCLFQFHKNVYFTFIAKNIYSVIDYILWNNC